MSTRRVEMPDEGALIIDHIEQEILRANHNVSRNTISTLLSGTLKKAHTADENAGPLTEKLGDSFSEPTPSSTSGQQ